MMTHSFAAGAAVSSPLYKEIRSAIMSSLAKGEWKPGEVIPSEFALADRFGVSKGTVRRALDELVSEKILVRRQGSGTFVATHSRDRTMYHFFHLVGRDGKKEYPVTELFSYRVVAADRATCARLNIPTGSRIIAFRNLVKIKEEPVAINDILVPQEAFNGLSRRMLEERESTIYALYQGRFSINVIHISEQLSAGHAPSDVAARLCMAKATPVLIIDRVAYTYHDRPVELRRSWVNTKGYVYLSDLRKS